METPFNDLYKEFRNRLRPFSPTSIVNAAIRTLRSRSEPGLTQLQMQPWQVLLIVKWALQDKMCSEKFGSAISIAEFDALRQHIHDMSNRMSLGPGGFTLKFRRLINPQIVFQRRFTPAFVREFALLTALDTQHPLQEAFRTRAGIDAQDFMDLAFAAYARVLDDHRKVSLAWYAPLGEHYGMDVIRRFSQAVSADIRELTDFLRALPECSIRRASEYFEVSPIRRFPFVRLDEALECWHPMIFYRAMEEMVHLTMAGAGVEYIEPFSKIFERHAIGDASTVPVEFFNEQQLRQILGSDAQTPDGLLSAADTNIFVETKAGIFDDAFMAVGSPEILYGRTKQVRDAIRQGWNASRQIRSSSHAGHKVRTAGRDYLLVVTNREIGLGSGRNLLALYPEGRAVELAAEASAQLPPENIFIISIDDFERLNAAARAKTLDIAAFLRRCAERDSDPTTAKYYFDQHLTSERVDYGWSQLVQDALDSSEERIRSALGGHD